MIIFGTGNRSKTVDMGQFYCPHCETNRTYERKKAKRYFTLYFIPIIPIGDIGEFVECQTCHITYEPKVLTIEPQFKQIGAAELLNSVKSRLLKGDPVEYVTRDMTVAGIERDIALALVTASIGTERKLCSDCNLSYASTLSQCYECSQSLGELET